MATRKILLVVRVDEEVLPAGNPYTELPDKLFDAIHETLPRGILELEAVYLLNPAIEVEKEVSRMALNYHHYAVNIRGEKCEEDDCEQHPMKNILSFHDHQKRNRAPPGVN